MVTTLSKLVDMIQSGAVPAWLRNEVQSNRNQIAAALREKGSYTFIGPDGEQIEIRAEKQARQHSNPRRADPSIFRPCHSLFDYSRSHIQIFFRLLHTYANLRTHQDRDGIQSRPHFVFSFLDSNVAFLGYSWTALLALAG